MIYGNLTKLNKTDKNSNCKIYNHKMETSYSAIDFFILLLYQHRSFITNEMEFYLIFLERNISSSIFFYDFVFGYQLIIIFYLCFFFVNNSLRFMWENLFFLCANKIKIKIFENIFNRYIFSLLSTFFLLLATFSGGFGRLFLVFITPMQSFQYQNGMFRKCVFVHMSSILTFYRTLVCKSTSKCRQ